VQFNFFGIDEYFAQSLCYEPTKMCRVCSGHFGIQDLNKDKHKSHGVNNICKKCHSINMQRRKIQNKKRRDEMGNWYIKDLLNKKSKIKPDIPLPLIEAKKVQLKLNRKLKNLA